MRWLQWSTADLEHGLGGVEVHARSLARELKVMGIEAHLSSDPADFQSDRWDVIHTHGSGRPGRLFTGKRKAVRVHTLHGTTLGRMAACSEWLWPGGYKAACREVGGVVQADAVLSVHPQLHLLRLAQRMGKVCCICWNGWDASSTKGQEERPLVEEALRQKYGRRDFWLFLGRGADPMKGVDRLIQAMQLLPDIQFVAAPGEGFPHGPQIELAGPLSSLQVSSMLQIAAGLVLPSRYEGNSLVLLEALSEGIPIVATRVGAVPVLPRELEGLVIADSGDPRAIADAVRAAERMPRDPESRRLRAEKNRSLLPTWRQVAESALAAVKQARGES